MLFFIKVYFYFEAFSVTKMLLLSLKEVLKEVCVLYYLCNSGTMLISEFQNKSAVYHTVSIFLTNFILYAFPTLFDS